MMAAAPLLDNLTLKAIAHSCTSLCDTFNLADPQSKANWAKRVSRIRFTDMPDLKPAGTKMAQDEGGREAGWPPIGRRVQCRVGKAQGGMTRDLAGKWRV